MLRVSIFGIAAAALMACKGDSGPTSPASSNALAGGDSFFSTDALASNAEGEGQGRPHSSNVEALVTFTSIRGHVRTCEGEDGFYAENHPTLTGTVIGDPRLSGIMELRATELVYFGVGIHAPSFGHVVIRDSRGKVKVEGDYNAWGENDALQGTIVGRAADASAAEGGALIANIRFNFFENGGETAQIGGVTTDNRLTAGVWEGRCTGKFTEYEGDIPAPSASISARALAEQPMPSLWRQLRR
jgi:hypothetical protein